MNIKKYILSIEILCKKLETASPNNRIMIYAAIKQLVDDVLSYVDECKKYGENIGRGHAHIYFAELLSYVTQVAGLEENHSSEDQQFALIHGSIDKLRTNHCFNLT